ncbi:MBL fold metallo-hydrolase [Streptacidiphilus sp. ASG 303]|uniref:MBL fold metallo-hydrolase n=1 Tax=Streptacidiphilus sp. ASG 303 TaxID=2896847 RepID=UPI001E38819E|nr:MBL fold metallo-hydrolase [Streptacidiphilus sp. ASG 303]MCD0481390.1 MBL fold metallo-hydrolase [Streptacidiphilus sp. ASG 303]
MRRLRPAAFGAEPTGARLERILRSPHFADGSFQNPVPTRRLAGGSPLQGLTAVLGADRSRRRPATAVPLHPLAAADLAEPPASGLRTTWLGHATVLVEIDGRRVLIDPVWSERCSPFARTGPRRLHPVPLAMRDLGRLDAVVVSHDHYDHLDMATVRALARHTEAVFAVPLGVGAHLEHWGVPEGRITELDWWESAQVAGLTLTAAPARHYCSRGPRTSPHLLWASWVVAGPDHRVYHSGDTGYFPGFAGIGERLGPFDAAMVQVGAYGDLWPEVHMTPEEGVRAHLDLRGGLLLPIHWGTFDLAPHPWEEPAERTVAAALAAGAPVAVPRPGEPVEPADPPGLQLWWRTAAVVPPGGTGWPALGTRAVRGAAGEAAEARAAAEAAEAPGRAGPGAPPDEDTVRPGGVHA